jgi:hypothetical protein
MAVLGFLKKEFPFMLLRAVVVVAGTFVQRMVEPESEPNPTLCKITSGGLYPQTGLTPTSHLARNQTLPDHLLAPAEWCC